MMVTFVSQCEKKALNRSRRVLDAFANRIGDNTWQTVITQEGLLAVKKLLRKTASKNTAVSCHWIRSRSRTDLVWVVGNKEKFNQAGVVPVNSTKRNLLYTQIENDWKYLPLIKALVAMSALLHDWGKASALFQEKLKPSSKQSCQGDPIRHEWISCLLLNAFIKANSDKGGSDSEWLTAFSKGNIDENLLTKIAKQQERYPLSKLPPMAKLLCWLIVSHHRLPLLDDSNLKMEEADSIDSVLSLISVNWGYENNADQADQQRRINQCFHFPNGLVSNSNSWLASVKKWSKRLMNCEDLAAQALSDGSYRLILSHSRLCLMLGDHFYSSQDADGKWQENIGIFANTDRKTKQLKQKLDEHLVKVANQGLRNAHLLPYLETEPPSALVPSALKKLSPMAFRWQDKATAKIKNYHAENKDVKACFVVNMASTGCGKTFANAKVMSALSHDGNSLRFILALGLRTLTLQTGHEYRNRVGLKDDDLAVLIGSRAVIELDRQRKLDEDADSFENSGSISEELLLEEDIDYDCDIPEEGFATVLKQSRDRQFLYAPVLACTIDHLISATETKRGGRYILPTLRLMSSDLVIDEIDDFTGNDLIAIGRLIHLAGMFGRKVMISSATIPPDLAEGYFKAYRDGWRLYSLTRDASKVIACMWIDEFSSCLSSNTARNTDQATATYKEAHQSFVKRRVSNLEKQPAKRKADIAPCKDILQNYREKLNDQAVIQTKQQVYFDRCLKSALALHNNHHTVDLKTNIKVSFGVIRVANIKPCIELTQQLLMPHNTEATELRVMAYHSQQVLLLRHEQEKHLDAVLKRKEKEGEQPRALMDSTIRKHLDTIHQINANQEKTTINNVLFIVVATPVEEVGRDHDFDWAVVEPSSYRSIIQLAGRVRRHRHGPTEQPNIHLMQYNWRALKNHHKENNKAFIYPGFEDKLQLRTHDLTALIDTEQVAKRLDAIPRIQKTAQPQPRRNLADLEHHVTHNLLTSYDSYGPASLQGYLQEPWFLTALPQKFTPFRQGPKSLKVFLVFDPDRERYVFHERNPSGDFIDREKLLGITHNLLTEQQEQRLWITRDFSLTVEKMAVEQNRSLRAVSIRYGELSFLLKESANYEYNDQLGLVVG